MTLEKIENYLNTYTLQEIIEDNDLTEAEVLLYLVEQEILTLPLVEPL